MENNTQTDMIDPETGRSITDPYGYAAAHAEWMREMDRITATPRNRRLLREHAARAIARYSPVMSWLVRDVDGDLYAVIEAQGQTTLRRGAGEFIVDTQGSVWQAHGQGGSDERTVASYLSRLLGPAQYARLGFRPVKIDRLAFVR